MWIMTIRINSDFLILFLYTNSVFIFTLLQGYKSWWSPLTIDTFFTFQINTQKQPQLC